MRMNKKLIVSLVLCIGVLFMAVGYSFLMTELKINGSASISSTWDIRVTGITEISREGSAYNIEEPRYTVSTAKFNVALVNPGDSISFKVTIENKGSLTAILNSMDITTSGTSAIIYDVNGLVDGDTLASGEIKNLYVTATYNSNEIADPYERVKRLTVGLDWVQYTNQDINPKTYTIAYNSNGGVGSVNDSICAVGSFCTLEANSYTKQGYNFAGWSTSPTGEVIYANREDVKNLTSGGKKIVLYAVWK